MKNPEESKKIAYSYLATFYNNIELLNQHYSQYCSILAQFTAKYGEDPKNVEPQDISILVETVNAIRQVITNLKIRAASLIENFDILDDKENEEVLKLSKDIENTYLMKSDAVYKFIVKMNSLLIKTTIPDLLRKNQDLLDGLEYG